MNAYRTYLLWLFLLLAVSAVRSQETDSLSVFLRSNPDAVVLDVVYEGSKVYLSADDDWLLINFSVAHPALQMRFLMQPFSIVIDPSGKKRRRYEIMMPSAMDVKDEIEGAVPHQDATKSKEERPDITPLLAAINQHGATYQADGRTIALGYHRFYVEPDPKNDRMNYYVLIPKAELMECTKLSETWSLGIISMNDFASMPPPGGDGGSDGGMMPPPMEGDNQEDIQELMQSDIRSWVKFSIDDVNNVNLK